MKLIITSIIVILIAYSFHLAVQKTEQSECRKWEKQAKEFTNFYYTQWQKEQCNIN